MRDKGLVTKVRGGLIVSNLNKGAQEEEGGAVVVETEEEHSRAAQWNSKYLVQKCIPWRVLRR